MSRHLRVKHALLLLYRRRRVSIIMACIALVLILFYVRYDQTESFNVIEEPSTYDISGEDKQIKADIAIGIISSKNYHHKVNAALSSWISQKYEDMAIVFSDSANKSALTRKTIEVMNTGCPDTYTMGLWCKNMIMFRTWKFDPRFKNTKWFFRAMDDTWVHLQNLYHLVGQHDHTKPILIGEKVCYWTGDQYPDGGPGFVMSKGFIDAWTEEVFNRTLDTHEGETLDDIMFGQLLTNMKVKVTHHPGFTHAALEPRKDSTHDYYASKLGKPWPLAHRPVASHQGVGKALPYMPKLHALMHQIRFNNTADMLYSTPVCDCGRGRIAHGRCSYGPKYQRTGSGKLADHGPGPWP